MKTTSRIRLATKIIGGKIFTRQGENIGTIQNLIFYPDSGTIVYIVLCYANFIGKINRYFAIPSQILKSNPKDGRSLILDENWKALLSTPSLSHGKWPLQRWGRNDRSMYELSESDL